ncbi:MAG: flagellar hook-length control protein FliK [Pseudomonadota bacterium]
MDTASSFPLLGGTRLHSASDTALPGSDSAPSDPSADKSDDFEATVTSLKVKEDATLKAQSKKPSAKQFAEEPLISQPAVPIAETETEAVGSVELVAPTEQDILTWDADQSDELTSLIAALPLEEDEVLQVTLADETPDISQDPSAFIDLDEFTDTVAALTDGAASPKVTEGDKSVAVEIPPKQVSEDVASEETVRGATEATRPTPTPKVAVPEQTAISVNANEKIANTEVSEALLRPSTNTASRSEPRHVMMDEAPAKVVSPTVPDAKPSAPPVSPPAQINVATPSALQLNATPKPLEDPAKLEPTLLDTKAAPQGENELPAKTSETVRVSSSAQATHSTAALDRSQPTSASGPASDPEADVLVEKSTASLIPSAAQTSVTASTTTNAGIGVVAPQVSERRSENMRAVEAVEALLTGRDSASTDPLRQAAQERVFSASPSSAPQPVARQIAEALVSLRNGTIDVQLSPEELGRVRLTMSQTETGMLVQVQAERPETLDLLRRNIGLLNDEFSALDLGTASFSFDDSSRSEDGSYGGQHLATLEEQFLETEPELDVGSTVPVANLVQQAGKSRLDIRL